MPAEPNVTPSQALQNAIQEVHSAVATLSPDDQTRVNYALQALEPVLADELNRVAATYLAKLPVFGGLADGLVKGAINQVLEDGLAQLTAAKAAIAP